MYCVPVGSFAVVCLMIGASVDKGYARTPAVGCISVRDTNVSSITSFNVTTSSYNVTTSSYNFTTSSYSVTANVTDGTTAVSLTRCGEENGEMSKEEEQIRLSYAVSLTFMVGLIQVNI